MAIWWSSDQDGGLTELLTALGLTLSSSHFHSTAFSCPVQSRSPRLVLYVQGGTIGSQITGDSNAETLVGYSFDDVITGNAGDDTLTGNDGSDTFDYNSVTDGNDTITDFEIGMDMLDIGDLLDYTTGNNLADYLTVVDVGNGNDVTLSIDADGTGGTDITITLSGIGTGALTLADLEPSIVVL